MTDERTECLGCKRDLEPGSRYFVGRVRFANGYACAGCAEAFSGADGSAAAASGVDRSTAFFVGNTGGYTGATG
jgi:hypothetical protein